MDDGMSDPSPYKELGIKCFSMGPKRRKATKMVLPSINEIRRSQNKKTKKMTESTYREDKEITKYRVFRREI